MDKIFIIKLAFRNLLSRKLRTILTLAGIVIGISAIVFLISFGYGIERLVTDQVTNEDAYELIDVGTGSSQIVKLNTEMLSKISAIGGVKNVETITNLGGKVQINGNALDIVVFGVSASKYLNWSGKQVRFGEGLIEGSPDKVVINSSYAALLSKEGAKAVVGSKITLDVILPKELSASGQAQSFPGKEFSVAGVIKEDSSPSVYASMAGLAVPTPAAVSQIKVKIDSRNDVDTIRKTIEAYGLKTEYVGDTVSQVTQFFNIFKIVLGSFGLIALIVALLGMFNTLTISLLERIKEVALMKILGMGRKDIQNLFLVEAMTLGMIGGVIGIAWGIILGAIANTILNTFAVRSGGEAVAIFYFSPILILTIIFIAIMTGFITGIYPANRAKRIDALDVLRYE